MIYFNPDDPALWLETRFGVGYTLNFGRPMAWVIVLGFVGATGLLIVLTVPLTATVSPQCQKELRVSVSNDHPDEDRMAQLEAKLA